MKIGCLTSSRADYGIYLPLLEKLKTDSFFELEVIAFGTHLSPQHGFTVNEIEKGNFNNVHKISSLLSNDDQQSVSTSYGLTVIKFADFWQNNTFDLVLCLGDRFEMNAAVQAGIPYNVKFAHFHGGETTLGAIDNIYRHQITAASDFHFTAAEGFSEKVAELKGENKHIYTVGSLSLDNIDTIDFVPEPVFREKYKIHNNFVLVTFHSETVNAQENKKYAAEMAEALYKIASKIDVVITMPNADTMGSLYREAIIKIQSQLPDNIILIENFGKQNYFSAMKYCSFMLGNTSSGIIEAASFGKYVVNVGDRQKGRLQSNNIINASFDAKAIEAAAVKVQERGNYNGENEYYKEDVALNIITIIKNIYEEL